MSRVDRLVTAIAAGTVLLEAAVASLLLFVGTSAAAHAAEAAVPVAAAPSGSPHLFDMLDRNKDQVLSRQEFQSGYAGLQRLIAMQARLREQFAALDFDRSGAIDANEYANLELIKRMGTTAPSLSVFDANRDQKLDFAEYAALVRKLAPSRTPTKK